MSRKKRTTADADGTPIETDEFLPDDDEDVAPVVSKPSLPAKRTVIWTTKGEESGAWSEHGQHTAGEKVETDHANILVERGFAEDAG